MGSAFLEYAAAYVDGKVWVFDFSFVELNTNFEVVGKVGEFGDCVEREGLYSRYWVRKWPRHIERRCGKLSIQDREELCSYSEAV
jgi:hypothetical protein